MEKKERMLHHVKQLEMELTNQDPESEPEVKDDPYITFTTRMKKSLHRKLKIISIKNDVNIVDLLEEAVTDWFENQ